MGPAHVAPVLRGRATHTKQKQEQKQEHKQKRSAAAGRSRQGICAAVPTPAGAYEPLGFA
jgi:hypothetical protein